MTTALKPALELSSVLERVLPKLQAIDDATAGHSTAEGKWSRKEILGHLSDSACNNHRRFVTAQGREDLSFEGYDQEHWVRTQRYRQESWKNLVQLWHAYNRHLVWVIDGIPESELVKSRKTHTLDQIADKTKPKEESVSLGYLVDDYIDHLENHLRQIL